jgi:hypothetical protein
VRALAAMALVGWFALPRPAFAQAWTVWATTEDDLVRPADGYARRQLENPVWDGRRVRLVAARNETVAFQLVVRAEQRAIDALSVFLTDLTRADGGDAIADQGPSAPTSPGRPPIRLAHVVDGLALEPQPVHEEGAMRVPLTENRSWLVEIEVEARRTAGAYRGALIVRADRERTLVPVELQVVDLILPRQPTLEILVADQHATISLAAYGLFPLVPRDVDARVRARRLALRPMAGLLDAARPLSPAAGGPPREVGLTGDPARLRTPGGRQLQQIRPAAWLSFRHGVRTWVHHPSSPSTPPGLTARPPGRPTMELAVLRRAAQDHALLALAARTLGADLVNGMVDGCLEAWLARLRGPLDTADVAQDLEDCRARLAAAVIAQTR